MCGGDRGEFYLPGDIWKCLRTVLIVTICVWVCVCACVCGGVLLASCGHHVVLWQQYATILTITQQKVPNTARNVRKDACRKWYLNWILARGRRSKTRFWKEKIVPSEMRRNGLQKAASTSWSLKGLSRSLVQRQAIPWLIRAPGESGSLCICGF